ncbi:MAG: hypothetical protein WC764_04310 [Candidatus Paceibacterota bacterium]|jgi:hypothetical protein
MSKIYEYKDLKNILKVGDEVRAVEGKHNMCVRLKDDGSNTQKITSVVEEGFDIDGCTHYYRETCYLEIVSPEPKTLDNLEVGDVIQYTNHNKFVHRAEILEKGMSGKTFLLSLSWREKEQSEKAILEMRTATGGTYHIEQLRREGWSVVQPEIKCDKCGK